MASEDDLPDEGVRLLLTLEFKSGSSETVGEVLRRNAAPTRKEEGCLDFRVFQIDGTDSSFVILEHWRSRGDLELHWKMPYMQEVFDMFDALLTQPLTDGENVLNLTDTLSRPRTT